MSNHISPTNAEHVRRHLDGKLRLIVDGGQSQVGIESTVLDLTASPPRLLRPGMIHQESLAAVIGDIQHSTFNIQHPVLRSPGLLAKHYSPKAKLVMLSWQDNAGLRAHVSRFSFPLSRIHLIAHTHIPSAAGFAGVSVIPHDAEAFARALYAELHRCDAAGAELIVMEELPQTSDWQAIADRLRRASAE